MSIGQGDLLVTPLQMATVAQTIGNYGVRMEPYLVEQAIDQDGRTTFEADPERAERVISDETAAALTEMMRNVVNEGTGTAAALEGVDVAGKTGTAERDIAAGINDAWFIGFDDQTAVAVVVEQRPEPGRHRRRPDREVDPGVPRWLNRQAQGAHLRPARARTIGLRHPTPSARPSAAGRSSTSATRSSRGSAAAGWPTSTAPRTRSSAGRSR